MVKVMNVVFGIGIAIIVFLVVILGIKVFYNEPVYEDYCPKYGLDLYNTEELCIDAGGIWTNESISTGLIMEDSERIIEKSIQCDLSEARRNCQDDWDEASDNYGRNYFLIANIIGIIAIIVSMFLFSVINIAAGTAFSGLGLIIWGFMRGWEGTGDALKFSVALPIAILFIVFAVMINKRYSKEGK